jgi:hypothetical protein
MIATLGVPSWFIYWPNSMYTVKHATFQCVNLVFTSFSSFSLICSWPTSSFLSSRLLFIFRPVAQQWMKFWNKIHSKWGYILVPCLPRCKATLILDDPANKTHLSREYVFIQIEDNPPNKMSAKKKYFTINFIQLTHKACEILSVLPLWQRDLYQYHFFHMHCL